MTAASWRRSAVANISVMIPYHALDSLLVFLYTMIIARSLGVEDFGLFATVVGASALLFLLVDFGASLRIVRDVAAGVEVASALKSTLALRLAVVAVLGGMAGLAWLRGPAWTAMAGLFCLLAAAEGLRSVQALTQGALLGQKRPLAVAAVGLLEKGGILLVLLIWPETAGALGLPAAALALMTGRLASVVAAVSLTRDLWSAGIVRVQQALSYLRSSRDVGLFVVSERSLAYGLPLLVTLSAGVAATGQFQAAFKILMVPVSFFTSFASALYPVVAGMGKSTPAETRRAVSLGLFAILVAASWSGLLLLLCGEGLVLLVFGEAFRPAGTVLQALAPVAVMAAIWQYCLHILTGLHRERLVLRSSLLSTVSVSLLVVLLGALFGLHALPLALLAGFALASVLYLPALFREALLSIRTLRPLGLAGAVILSLITLLIMRRWVPGAAPLDLGITATALTLLLPAALILTRALPVRPFFWRARPRLGAWTRG